MIQPRGAKVNHDRWLVSYADFITLLFAFFVVLYAFAKSDEKREIHVSEAIHKGFRSLSAASIIQGDAQTQITPDPNTASLQLTETVMEEADQPPSQVRDDLKRLRADLEQRLSAQIQKRIIALSMGRDGLVISLREAGFFAPGSAIPEASTAPTLRQIVDSIRHSPYAVRIEGHTDNTPIHNSEFDSNWELSASRATNIAHLILDMHQFPPERLSVAGYAEYHPLTSNMTPEGRAQNRRVDLIIAPRLMTNLATLPPTLSSGKWKRITDD